ncbi:PaaI family thioesterase [uncultured Sphingomonas sp.]|uniref:PaaI family thioesterase n=1 Tax=uncultured Sphingomonas sp. TaxID=158754 RepID=UPI0035CBC6AF
MTAPALPPYARLLGLTAAPQADGPPLLVMPFADPVLGRPGFLHGGAIAGLLEMAAIAALRHALEDAGDTRIKPVNVTMDFLRGGRDHPTCAAGSVVRIGGRVANVAATAWQEDRARPIAAARITCLLVRA